MSRKTSFDNAKFRDNVWKVANTRTQKEIADKVGITQARLSKLFNGTEDAKPSIEELLRISNAYRCSIDFLVGNDMSAKKDLTDRQICEMIIAIAKQTGALITAEDNSSNYVIPENSNSEKAYYGVDRDVSISISIIGDMFEGDLTEQLMKNDSIIEFFSKYCAVQDNMKDLPEDLSETLVNAYLEKLDKGTLHSKTYDFVMENDPFVNDPWK